MMSDSKSSIFPPRPSLLVLAVLLALPLHSGCKKSEDHSDPNANEQVQQNDPPAEPPPQAETGKALKTFDPELLLGRLETMDNMVLLPPGTDAEGNDLPALTVYLKREDRTQYFIKIRIAVECTSGAYVELWERKKYMNVVLTSSLETKTLAEAASLEGKMNLKEEIIKRLKDRMRKNKGIKQIYYQQYEIGQMGER